MGAGCPGSRTGSWTGHLVLSVWWANVCSSVGLGTWCWLSKLQLCDFLDWALVCWLSGVAGLGTLVLAVLRVLWTGLSMLAVLVAHVCCNAVLEASLGS